MTTREAIEALAKELREELVVCTTGYTCRDMQHAADRPGNFYMIGSMGLAAPIGLGIALARPQRQVVIFDGDGALLMGLGVLPMVGALAPKRLMHVVFDNEAFSSTGGQRTYSSATPLDRLAGDCGYPSVERASDRESLMESWRRLRARPGPTFLLVKCRPDANPPKERVRLEPESITDRFRKEIHAN